MLLHRTLVAMLILTRALGNAELSPEIEAGEVAAGGAASVEGAAPTGDCEAGVCLTPVTEEERTQADYYNKNGSSHYDKLWGQDNIHFGYYPHLATLHSETAAVLSYPDAATLMTERMVAIAGIKAGDRVLDLGSGKGLACVKIAELTGASCTGLELSQTNVDRANALAAARPELDLAFFAGSFTDVPEALLSARGPFDVVFSQVAWCHVHGQIEVLFKEVVRSLEPTTGRLVISDFLGGDGPPSALTMEHVYKRMHFKVLIGHTAWRAAADATPDLVLKFYENLDAHLERGYSDLADGAQALNLRSTDGALLAENYRQSALAVVKGELGMNLGLYAMRG